MKIIYILGASLLYAAPVKSAIEKIGALPEGTVFEVQVPFEDFERINDPQHQPEWCWAASVSDVFRFYHHRISQETIVRTVFGGLANLPAYSSRQIAQLLNRTWTDDDHRRFRSQLIAAYDAQAGVNAIDNAIMIGELRDDHPLIVCNTHHCMVITEAKFTPMRVLSVGVFDPWPFGLEAHPLTPLELTPATQMVPGTFSRGQLMFVAAVRVTDLTSDEDVTPGLTPREHPAAGPRQFSVGGDWSGILRTPRGNLKFVLHITQDGSDLEATADSPYQRAYGIPVDNVAFDANELTFAIDTLNAEYKGKLNGRQFVGTFTQYGTEMRLNLSRD